MLTTDAGKQALHRFFEQYLGYAGVASMQEAQHRDVRVGRARHGPGDARLHQPGRVPERGRPGGSADGEHDQPVAGAGHLLRHRQHVHGRLPGPRQRLRVGDAAGGAGHRRAGAGGVPGDPRRVRRLFADQARPVHVLQAVLRGRISRCRTNVPTAGHDDTDGGRQHDARSLRKGPRADQRRGRELRLLPQAVRSARVRVRTLRRGRALPRQGEDVRHQRVGHGRRAGRRRSPSPTSSR